jgi:tetratricopeptide (TPR) repeat protein
MTAAGTPESRDVIPRWRPFGSTVRSGETAPLGQDEPAPTPADLSEPEEAFRLFPGQHTAADLVSAALSSARATESAKRAARYLLGADGAPRNAIDVAQALLLQAEGGRLPLIDKDAPHIDFEEIRERVNQLRRIVRAEPRNAVRWADLALAHTVLGHPEQAEREIRTALAVAGPHRFLLRSAARLYVHMEQPDAAHDLLVRDPAVLVDPWLAAAELATSTLAGHQSKYLKRARAVVEDGGGYAPRHLAELASQVATSELRAGRAKHAKRLMTVALIDPTDNALAQAEWASANGLTLDPASLDVPRTYEARALRYAHVGDWQAASNAGFDWLADEPFDQGAAQFTSYTASVGAQDWRLAERAARTGLVANPESHMLRNNLAFALANQGQIDDAATELRQVHTAALNARELAVLEATQGLVRFRLGQLEAGRKSYRDAIAALVREEEPDLAALATAFWAREEILASTESAGYAAAAAAEIAKATGAPEAALWVERLEQLRRELESHAGP